MLKKDIFSFNHIDPTINKEIKGIRNKIVVYILFQKSLVLLTGLQIF